MRQTIIGVAAPANAPPNIAPSTESVAVPASPLRVVTPPVAAGVNPPVKGNAPARPNLKRTIIGGLDAAPGSAPTPQAIGLGIATEPKWNVLIPKQGAVEMTAPDLVRAFVEGKLTRETNAWREGLSGWKPLHEIDSLCVLFRRAGLSLDPPAPVAAAPVEPRPNAKPNAYAHVSPRASTSEPPPTARTPALTESTEQLFDAQESDGSDEVTRIAASPWDVLDAGAKAAAQLAASAGLPPRQNSIPPSQPTDPEHGRLDRPSRRPDIGPRATVRGQLAAISSAPAPAPHHKNYGTSEPLPQPRIPTQSQPILAGASTKSPTAETTRPPPAPAVSPERKAARSALDALALAPAPTGTNGHDNISASQPVPNPARTNARHRWLIAVLVVLSLSTAVIVSYRTKQPRALHAVLHRRGWDVAIERRLQSGASKLNYATQICVVRPYRAVARKLHKK